ncbi:MAG: hypothetical protein KC466_07595, partial [Myxococcales bacterium]|nr:hypothetical protein [Myxococcales bacterium]
QKDPGDVIDVLKLNLVRDFQTGIYDYNTMVSLFVESSDFSLVKQTFTSAEWCGHVYEDLVFGPKATGARVFSYFEDESFDGKITLPKGGVTEEQFLVLVRGLRGPYLQPGEKREVPFLPGTLRRRLAHRPLAWNTARIQRLENPETVTVIAGTFPSDVYVVHTATGRKGVFHVERAEPHRVVRWSWDQAKEGASAPFETAERAELAGTTRLPYWKLHREGHERYLADMGLPAGK